MSSSSSILQKIFGALNSLPLWKMKVPGRTGILCVPSLDRLLYLALHNLGWMGDREGDVFNRLIGPGMTVIDAGANIGLYTNLFSMLVGSTGRVHSFEPNPTLFPCLQESIQINRRTNVECHQIALSERAETLLFVKDHLNSGNGQVRRDSIKAEHTVPARPLDELFAPEIADFIKIDVQGWEPAVLSGMRNILSAQKKPLVFFEVSLPHLQLNDFSLSDCLKAFPSHEWHLHVIGEKPAKTTLLKPDSPKEHLPKGYFNILAIPSDRDSAILSALRASPSS